MAIITIEHIRNEILNMQRMDFRLEKIEAFVIHSEDMRRLLEEEYNQKRFHPSVSNGLLYHGEEEMRICGIKIIESPYVQKETIHKIFNDGQPYVCPQHFKTYLPKNKPIFFPEHLGFPAVADEKKTKNRHSTTRKVELGD